MCFPISLTRRVFPVVMALGLALGMATSQSAAGTVTTSAWLDVSGPIDVGDPEDPISVDLSGMVHVVSQAFETTDGYLFAVRANIVDLRGVGDDSTEWIGVGAIQQPPDPCVDGGELGDCVVLPTVEFDMIALSRPAGGLQPPDPIEPTVVYLALVFDANGRLLADQSLTAIGTAIVVD